MHVLKNPELPHFDYPGFSLEEMDTASYAVDFHFEKLTKFLSWLKHLVLWKDLPASKEPSTKGIKGPMYSF